MAKVWMVKEGLAPNVGEPWRTISLLECQKKLDLKQDDFIGGLDSIPKFGDSIDPNAAYKDPTLVVIEIDDAEAETHTWKLGFYKLGISPREAEVRCAYDQSQ